MMKFDDLLRLFGNKVWFDFEMVHVLSGEAAECVYTELYRWRQTGRLIELRRGLFTLAEPWRRCAVEGAVLAEPVYAPSYLTGRWALERREAMQKHPRTVEEYTSATARPARTFENGFGRYAYATFPRDLLFGTTAVEIGGRRVRMALPEKALLDLCFAEGGDWDEGRFEAEGIDPGALNPARLIEMAARAGRPRLARAAGAFLRYAERRARAAGREAAQGGAP